MSLRRGWVFSLCLAVLSLHAVSAQEPTEDPGPLAQDPAAGESTGMDEIDDLLEDEELMLSNTGYTYEAEGRRDPFVSLIKQNTIDRFAGARPPGIPGLLIDEIDLKGIFEMSGQWVALVETAEREKSYLIREGDQLFDGDVTGISLNEVVFKQIVNDPKIFKPFREVVKKLNQTP
jgi:Tfp pilus assembly protein PilP